MVVSTGGILKTILNGDMSVANIQAALYYVMFTIHFPGGNVGTVLCSNIR